MTLRNNPAPKNDDRFQQICLAAAFLITLTWGLIYIGYGNPGFVDEPGHVEVIRHFFEQRPGIPSSLPHLPGYHFLVILLSGESPSLTSARAVTLGFSLLGLAAFAWTWRRLHGSHPGGSTLLCALLPIMQPFTAMAYTDVPAMAFLCAAFGAHFTGRRAWSAALLAGACMMRQTNLISALYLVVLEAIPVAFSRAEKPGGLGHRHATMGQWMESVRWLLLLLGLAAALIVYSGRLTPGIAHGNQLEPNLATIHFAGVLLLFLGLPYWARNIRPTLRQGSIFGRARPKLSLVLALVGLLVVGTLAATYLNRHVWNRELLWQESTTFVLLRNWPLIWIERLPALRILSGFVVVGLVAGLGVVFSRQRYARELWLLLPFAAVLLLSNGLVDPRYYIPACVLGLLFLRPGRESLIEQIVWFAVLCALQSPFVLLRLALW